MIDHHLAALNATFAALEKSMHDQPPADVPALEQLAEKLREPLDNVNLADYSASQLRIAKQACRLNLRDLDCELGRRGEREPVAPGPKPATPSWFKPDTYGT